MKFVIVTGMSGAGKSTALKILEDLGYFCADNLPLPLVEKFAELSAAQCRKKSVSCRAGEDGAGEASGQEKESLSGQNRAEETSPMAAELSDNRFSRIALGVDIRSGGEIRNLPTVLARLREKKIPYEVLYLDASDAVLLKRYKETRRSHPLSRGGRIDEGIRLERLALGFLKEQADYILDTTGLLTRELRGEMEKIFVNRIEFRNIYITILSFGFKYGIPADSDLVFDVRFLPNPYYVDGLRRKTGLDQEVQDYVMKSEAAQEFLQRLTDMIEFLLPNYVLEGKNQLVISIGCTGGHHRSVTMAEQLYRHLALHTEYGVKLAHRDIGN